MTAKSSRRERRRGAALLEFAVACPILCLLLLGIVTLGLEVSQYQMLAELAREGARYASVHGADSRADGNAPVAAADVFNAAILPRAGLFAQGSLVSTITPAPSGGYPVGSLVSVTLAFRWDPAVYPSILPPLSISSTAVMAVSY